jgi:ribonuclease D
MQKLELEPVYVATSQKLEEACSDLSEASFLCIDTEFHREKSYYPQLGLIQVASRRACYLIDPLAIPHLDCFWQFLHDPSRLKVLHAGRQDVEIILSATGEIPFPIFDTQIAAALLGLGEQASLAKLVSVILNEHLPKHESFSDWLSRPLSPEQITYAASDVIYLLPIYEELKRNLLASGRMAWLEEEQNNLYNMVTYEPPDDDALYRLRGTNGLSRRQLAILRSLAACRERIAREKNRPRRRIIPDETLVSLARLNELNKDSIRRLRNGLSESVLREFGDDILAAWQEGHDCPSSSWPRPRSTRPRNSGANLRAEMLSALVRFTADREKIAANILARKGELMELALWAADSQSPLPDLPCLRGWRRELIGDDLLRLLRGEISLRLDADSGMPVIDDCHAIIEPVSTRDQIEHSQ